MEYLSNHFTLEELIASQTATRRGIDNYPNLERKINLTSLCRNILEPVRSLVGYSINTSSGYRSKVLNAYIGGAKNSQHVDGCAADISVYTLSVEALYQLIKASDIPYDQLIQEFNRWVHISWSDNPRKQCLRARKVGDKTIYEQD